MFKSVLVWSTVACLAAGSAFAQPGRGRMAEKLNLTDSQKKEMENLQIDLQRKNIPLESQIRLARLEIRQQMTAEKPEKGKIEKWMKEVSELELQMKLNGLNHQFAVRALLTPEQLKLWKEGRHAGFGEGPDAPRAPMMERRLRLMDREGNDEPDVVIERKIEKKIDIKPE